MTLVQQAPLRWLLLFVALLAAAVACGAMAMVDAGVPVQRPLLNAAALLVGSILALPILRRGPSPRAAHWALACALLLLAATLLHHGIDGVHRWLPLGPFTVNIASLLVPAMVVLLARGGGAQADIAIIATTLAILVAQPDASQATAFAAGVAVLLRGSERRYAWLLTLFLALGAAAAWFRPDPLVPVAEVELIFALMWKSWPALAVIAGLCLAAATSVPALAVRGTAGAHGGLALSATLALNCLAPAVGDFPVPVVGYGMGFALGFPLALALLLAPVRKNP